MDDVTRGIREKIGAAYKENSRIVWVSTRWVRILLVLLGSLLAGTFALFSNGIAWPLSVPQFGGLFGGLMAFAGGVYIVVTDKDTSEILDEARKAVDWAAEQETTNSEVLDLLELYEDALEQVQSLYTALSLARGAIERAVFQSKTDEIVLLRACVETMKWNLRIALDFGINEIWTICVYKAERGDDGTCLRLVAHNRSVDCET
ncbi:MAG TPA: hypothetical protein DCX34_08400 [Roseovarius sp.]|nr:hypothetical protein [Roseovarius sp.]